MALRLLWLVVSLHLLRSVPIVFLLASSPVSAASVHAYVYFFHDTPWAQVSTPGLRWGPYIPQMTYLQVQLVGRATVVFLKTLRCPVWGPSPVYSFHKCLHDKILVSSLHDWEVCGLLKVYSIGIMESKSSLPLFPDYWHRWMVLLNYVHTQWYSWSVPRHCPLNTHTFFCLFVCFLRWSIWQPWWSQTGTGPELAAILQPIPPQCHHTGILFSINSLLPQLICYNDRKQVLHPFISSIKLHQWPYDESAQKRERHCHSLTSEKLPDSHMKAVDGLRRRPILRNDSKLDALFAYQITPRLLKQKTEDLHLIYCSQKRQECSVSHRTC